MSALSVLFVAVPCVSPFWQPILPSPVRAAIPKAVPSSSVAEPQALLKSTGDSSRDVRQCGVHRPDSGQRPEMQFAQGESFPFVLAPTASDFFLLSFFFLVW